VESARSALAALHIEPVQRATPFGSISPGDNGIFQTYSGLAQTSNRMRAGSSTHSLMRTRKVTASRPSTIR